MTKYRREKVGDLLLSFIAKELHLLADPRLTFITITAVDPAPDLKSARVYWSLLFTPANEEELKSGLEREQLEEKRRKDVAIALQGVEGLLRRRIGEELNLRYVPKLFFKYDNSLVVGSRIDSLLKEAGY